MVTSPFETLIEECIKNIKSENTRDKKMAAAKTGGYETEDDFINDGLLDIAYRLTTDIVSISQELSHQENLKRGRSKEELNEFVLNNETLTEVIYWLIRGSKYANAAKEEDLKLKLNQLYEKCRDETQGLALELDEWQQKETKGGGKVKPQTLKAVEKFKIRLKKYEALEQILIALNLSLNAKNVGTCSSIEVPAAHIADKLIMKGWMVKYFHYQSLREKLSQSTKDEKVKVVASSPVQASPDALDSSTSKKSSDNVLVSSSDDSRHSASTQSPPPSPTKNRKSDTSGSRKNSDASDDGLKSTSSPSSSPKKTKNLDASTGSEGSGNTSDYSEDDSKRSSSTETPPPSPKKTKNPFVAAKRQNNNDAILLIHPKAILAHVGHFTRFWWWVAGKLGIKTTAHKYSRIPVSSPTRAVTYEDKKNIGNLGDPDGKVKANEQKPHSTAKNSTTLILGSKPNEHNPNTSKKVASTVKKSPVLIHSARGVVGFIRNKRMPNPPIEKKPKVYEAASGQKFVVRNADTTSVEPSVIPVPFTLHKQKTSFWERVTSLLSGANPKNSSLDAKRLRDNKANVSSIDKDLKGNREQGHGEDRIQIIL
ncbi:MAG TPA: hypothetical protein VHE99_12235 [Gammaproteobacteria bacterium]|nr:hypothetical protein [Gammaproteobacteria bacterium]